MLSKYIKPCRIICFSEDDAQKTVAEASGIPFEIKNKWKPSNVDGKPTLLVGWSQVKAIYPDQNILVHKIDNNLFWTYSNTEDSEQFKKHLSEFIKFSSELFLSVPYESYDAIIDGDFKEFSLNVVLKSKNIFVYFSGGAMYVFDGFSEYGFNLDSMRYCGTPVKELVTWFLTEFKCIVLNRSNIKKYVKSNFLKNYISVENAMWSRVGKTFSEMDMLKMFDNADCEKHVPFFMSMLPVTNLSEDEMKSCIRYCAKDVVSEWLSERRIYFNESFTRNRLRLTTEGRRKYATLNYSAKTTLTGRMHCTEGSFNPQNLPKDSEHRKEIISRFDGGKLVVFDYVSFETKIATYMSGDKKFIETYKDKDMHAEAARVAFDWDGKDEKIRNIAKRVNHTILYGGGEATLEAILSKVNNPKKTIATVKSFLAPLLKKANELALLYDKSGYVINPFGTLIRPKKRWAAFNNYIQSTAADIVTEKIFEISSFMKSSKSQFVFQVHDSFVFDIHPSEEAMVSELAKMLSVHKKATFQVEASIGKSLFECGHTKSSDKKILV